MKIDLFFLLISATLKVIDVFILEKYVATGYAIRYVALHYVQGTKEGGGRQ